MVFNFCCKNALIKVVYSQSNLNKNFTGILSGPLQEADFELELPDGIELLELFSDSLKEKLGSPLKIEEINEVTVWRTYYYRDFQLVTDFNYDTGKETIIRIVITGENMKTNRGLKVGDEASKIVEKYGLCEPSVHVNGTTLYTYSFKVIPKNQSYNRFIYIVVEKNYVKEIKFRKRY